MRRLPVGPPYNLVRTLSCGQAFGWRVNGRAADGIFSGRRVHLEQLGGAIVVQGIADRAALRSLRHYLNLDEDLAVIEDQLRQDRVLRRALPYTTGIALLRQDPWECLISFIVSAFNNIPKIELSVGRLMERFGERGADRESRFPPPEALGSASLRGLRACALGYRAPYVAAVARLVASGKFDLERPRLLPYAEARRLLLTLPGVGEKVADCVLLFAYGKREAFPVDVWVKRAVERWYFAGRTVSEPRIREFAHGRFGPLAGYAQQHLFYHVRASSNRGQITEGASG
ncbi:MAG TPA: DNA glycosylase [bacterium]|nr:DNA glycosylase [bacterium]